VAKEQFRNGGESVGIAISLGIAVFPQHGNNSESLIRSADAALYEAKEGGRNRVVFAGATTEKESKKQQ
jgi:diguanylate cyclase (GGDEF)-like protein